MKHKRWHKVWHDRLLSDPHYLALSPLARGVLADIRCFAGRQNDEGDTGMTEPEIIRWYGRNRKSIQNAFKVLQERRLIEVRTESQTIAIPRWNEAQDTPEAIRQRRHRNRKAGRDSNVTVTGNGNGRGRGENNNVTSEGAKDDPPPLDPALVDRMEARAAQRRDA